MKKPKHFNIAMAVFGAFMFAMWSYLSLYACWHEIPAANRDLFIKTISTCEISINVILMYLFGSTVSSRVNAETIATIAKGKPNDEAQNIQ
jgi:hypothetical protein